VSKEIKFQRKSLGADELNCASNKHLKIDLYALTLFSNPKNKKKQKKLSILGSIWFEL
jgi:hypothetical protein